MNALARYHLVWALVLSTITSVVLGVTLYHWFRLGRPPIYHFWAQQMIVMAGVYCTWARVKAFNAARRS